mgnify:CR=1 FL=1
MKNNTPVNQVHLMQKLVDMQLDESKSVPEHLSLFTGTLSQLQDSGMAPFDDKLKAIFLLLTLPDSWETLVVSLSNNPNLTFDGVRGSILNEEIRRKASGEGGSSANMVRGRTDKRSNYAHRNKSKSQERGNRSKVKSNDVTCYQCGRKGHKKPDCRYYKAELERKKNFGDKKKDKIDAHDSQKDEEKANLASNVVIEELSDVEDILCATFSADDTYAYDASLNIHSQDMCITKNDLIDALLAVNDALAQTWIVDSGASFHVTPIKECFSTFTAGSHGHVYLGNNHACSIDGIGIVHFSTNGTNELVLHNVRYVPRIKKSLLSVGQMDMHGYSILFERGSWKMTKGSRLIVKGTKKGTLYCLHGNAISGKFIALAEVHSHMELWHKRLGHMSQKGLTRLCNLKKLYANGTKLDFCNECQYGKQVKCSFYSGVSRKSCVLDLVHSDVCSMPTKSMGGAMYFISFVDDFSRKIWVQLLKSKDEAFAAFQRFHAFVTTQTGSKLKCLRMDNGDEYTVLNSRNFVKFWVLRGSLLFHTAPLLMVWLNDITGHFVRE